MTPARMKSTGVALTRSRQDYVKGLYDLSSDKPVTVTALARHLGVSAPSVTNMLSHLAEERLVRLQHRGSARLTAAGEREALRMVRRHRILETFLVRVLGLDWAEVHEDAEVLEHHVSERVLEAIDRLCGHPSEDPHGHPIPDAQGHMPERDLLPLEALEVGAVAVVREVPDRDRPRMARWKAAGLVPGATIRMREVRLPEDVFEIEVEGVRHVSGSEGLIGIRVEPRAGGSR